MPVAAYMGVFVVPVFALLALGLGGAWSYTPVLVAFGVIPALELVLPQSLRNRTPQQEQAALANPAYDLLAYLMVPVQYGVLAAFLWRLHQGGLVWWEWLGMVLGMGMSCGVLGINVAHELGHRARAHEQWMARALLLSTLYLHFFVEHNRGHHHRVATPQDPARSQRGQTLYAFFVRSVVGGFVHAWQLETARLSSRGLGRWRHQVAWSVAVQLAWVAGIFAVAGVSAGVGFVLASGMGILLLETVNYIEHYGLRRNVDPQGKMERVMPWHSWNSNHVLGRALMFDLSRHSDHHAFASRKYQVLRHFDGTPQFPTGYPGMMTLAWFPPLFFRVMHPRLDALAAAGPPPQPAGEDAASPGQAVLQEV